METSGRGRTAGVLGKEERPGPPGRYSRYRTVTLFFDRIAAFPASNFAATPLRASGRRPWLRSGGIAADPIDFLRRHGFFGAAERWVYVASPLGFNDAPNRRSFSGIQRKRNAGSGEAV